MKKFRNWCNQNSGFIAFWGIVIMIIIWISSPLKIEFPRILNLIKHLLLYNLTVPVYGLLIFILLFIVVLRNKIGSWNRLFIKSVAQKIIDFPSDEENIFLGSPTYKDLPENTPVYVYRDGGYWNRYKQFTELNNSFWIAHTKLITDDQAIKGGTYLFEKKIEINDQITKIESAFIYMTIDDYCKLYINDKFLGEYSGIGELCKISIKEFLNSGTNTFRFELINAPGGSLSGTRYKTNIGKKGALNPYGVRYLVRIINK